MGAMKSWGPIGNNYYQILGVSIHASKKEIGEAYASRIKEFRQALSSGQRPAASQLDLLRKAYQVLSDEHERQTYDLKNQKVSEPALARREHRLAASFVDSIVATVCLLPIAFTPAISGSLLNRSHIPFLGTLEMVAIAILMFVVVHAYFLVKNGQTIGKKIVGIKIVDLDNQVPPLSVLLGRRYLPVLLLPLISVVGALLWLVDVLLIFKVNRRCIHDLIANTKVIVSRPNQLSAYWILIPILIVPALGILAAIVIPSYQQYTLKAKAAQERSVGAPKPLQTSSPSHANLNENGSVPVSTNGSVGNAPGAFVNDQWCKVDTTELKSVLNGCVSNGPLEELGLTSDEMGSAKRLEQLPWFPSEADANDVVKIIGAAPDHAINDSLIIYRKNLADLCDRCEIRVYFFQKHITMIRLITPHFMLQKKHLPP
jgi:uncharacterized RDD family membrane protein YckC